MSGQPGADLARPSTHISRRLYSQLKNHPNIQIVTFNVDEEIGNVEPYM